MKKVTLLVTLIMFPFLGIAQDFDSPRPAGSHASGVNIANYYNTNIQLTAHTHSASHGILFNAYKPSSTVSGSLGTAGNTKYAHDVLQYGGGAGAIMFYGNGGTMDFLISPGSTGTGTDVSWGVPKMRIKRHGDIGINTSDPLTRLHIVGDYTDDLTWPLIVNNPINASAISGYGVGIKLKHSGNNEDWKWGGIASVQESSWANNSALVLYANETEYMRIRSDGNVGIGTTTTGTHKLAVEGTIGAREVKVEVGTWSDFVFHKDYPLPTLTEVEAHIKANGHLKGIPNEAEVKANGINLGEMEAKLLQKIEELTLYLIEQNKQNEVQRQQIRLLQKQVNKLKKQTKN